MPRTTTLRKFSPAANVNGAGTTTTPDAAAAKVTVRPAAGAGSASDTTMSIDSPARTTRDGGSITPASATAVSDRENGSLGLPETSTARACSASTDPGARLAGAFTRNPATACVEGGEMVLASE
jgi:hypothetical protein